MIIYVNKDTCQTIRARNHLCPGGIFELGVHALPLYWFGTAAVRSTLYSIGFFQYITTTMYLFYRNLHFSWFFFYHTCFFFFVNLAWTGFVYRRYNIENEL